jgi:hypothetical protein
MAIVSSLPQPTLEAVVYVRPWCQGQVSALGILQVQGVYRSGQLAVLAWAYYRAMANLTLYDFIDEHQDELVTNNRHGDDNGLHAVPPGHSLAAPDSRSRVRGRTFGLSWRGRHLGHSAAEWQTGRDTPRLRACGASAAWW